MKIYQGITIAFIALWLICFSASCRKCATASNKVKTAIIYSYPLGYDTITYTYDQDGRRSILHNRFGTFRYLYSANTIEEIDSTNSGLDTTTLSLNAQGYVVSTSSGGIDRYDNNGYPSQIQGNGGLLFTYVYQNGDLIQFCNVQPNYDDTTTYSYYSLIDNRDYGIPFFGKSSTHLAKTFFNSPNTFYDTYQVQSGSYTYSFDQYNRVVAQTISGPSGVLGINTYTYY